MVSSLSGAGWPGSGPFRRVPRQEQQPLSREELRVYMACLGQRTAAELCEAARLTQQAIAGLLRLGLLQPADASAGTRPLLGSAAQTTTPGDPLSASQLPPTAQGFDVQRALQAVLPVLEASLGPRSEDVRQRLASAPDQAAFAAEIQRTASRLRLMVSVQAAEQLERAWQAAQS